MVALRLIPCLDVANGRVVKGVNFVNLRDAGDPVELARLYSDEGADELVFLDIKATYENRKTLVDLVSRTAKTIKIPFTVGGGVNSVESINELLRAGADKVSINSSAVSDPELILKSSKKFGSQCIVVAIDARKKNNKNDQWEVYVKGGRENTGIDVIEWARKVEKFGAGEILLTSMDGDGTQNGYDLLLNETIVNSVNIPVIASGGAGSLEHIYEVFTNGKASAALLASLLHDKKLTIKEIKSFLIEKGLLIRPNEDNFSNKQY
tara:strand:- start:19983 stop:20777 length:795 start_codon:yes stop_codon:yes gene_type:complete